MIKKLNWTGWNSLPDFYQTLIDVPDGMVLSVQQVKICVSDRERLQKIVLENMKQIMPEDPDLETYVNMLMGAYGPSVDNSVRPGTVNIKKTALRPAEA